MKRLALIPTLAFAALNAHATPTVDLSTNLTFALPTCSLTLEPQDNTIIVHYTTTGDPTAAGTFDGAHPPAAYLVKFDGCSAAPAIRFTLPSPTGQAGRIKMVDAHGVSWAQNSYLHNALGYESDDASGDPVDPVNFTASVSRSNGVLPNAFITTKQPMIKPDPNYYYSTTPQATTFSGYELGQTVEGDNNRVFTASGYNGSLTVFNYIPAATAKSVLIQIGAIFAKSGPTVGGVVDNSALVDGQNYGWTGTLTVTAV